MPDTLTLTLPARFFNEKAPDGVQVTKPGTRQVTADFTQEQLIAFMATAAHFANHKNFSPVPQEVWPLIDSARNTVKALDANPEVASFVGINGAAAAVIVVAETPDPAPEVGDTPAEEDELAAKRARKAQAAREYRARKKAAKQ